METNTKLVFSNAEDFEKYFFPKAFEQNKMSQEAPKISFGANLANEFLESIKKELKIRE